jgi:hypothetical protein
MFDPAQAGALAAFFRTALARDSEQRHASARDMLSAWQAIFANSSVPVAPAETRTDAALRLMSDAEALARAIDAGSPNANFVREGVLSDIVGVLARVDPARAEHVVGGLAADRAAALARIAGTVAGTDPAQAAQLLIDAQASLGEDTQYFPWPFPELLLVRRQIIRVVVGRRTLVPVTRSVARIDPAVAGRLLDSAERVVMLDQGLRDELLAGIAEAADRAVALAHLAVASKQADSSRAVEMVAEAEQTARAVPDRLVRGPQALIQVAVAAAIADPARAESIARSLDHEGANPEPVDRLWTARALVAVADAWLDRSTARELAG